MATITSPRPSSPSASTTTGTPTSSVRPSIDLSRNNPLSPTLSAASTTPTAARANRAKLRDYYNLKSKPTPTNADPTRTASIASTNSDSTITSSVPTTNEAGGSNDRSLLLARLDDDDFNAYAFVQELTQKSSLKDILRTEGQLIYEIRNLDGERKSLVYDNYGSLITAVGTLGEIQRSLDGGLGREWEGMRGRMGVLEGMGKELSGVDAAKGGEDRETRKRERRKREVVRWVLESEERLQKIDIREAKEMEWAKVKMVLDQWEDVRGVKEVRARCQAVMERPEMGEDG